MVLLQGHVSLLGSSDGGPPLWQMVDKRHLATDKVDWDEKMLHMTILGKHFWTLGSIFHLILQAKWVGNQSSNQENSSITKNQWDLHF